MARYVYNKRRDDTRPQTTRLRVFKGQKMKRLSDQKQFTVERQNSDGTLVFEGYDGRFSPDHFAKL